MTFEWTPKRTEALIKLWKSGAPTSEIGRKLKVTKNAVVGKAHRLGLAKRQSPIPGRDGAKAAKPDAARAKPLPKVIAKPVAKPLAKSEAKSEARPVAKPVAKPAAPAAPARQPAAGIAGPAAPAPKAALQPISPDTVVRLENLGPGMCAWPMGEPGTAGFHFCGKRPTVPDKPYCLDHCLRAYVKSSKDRKEAAPANG